jgi:hypothetical protein
MDIFCKEICDFLNTLDDKLPLLLQESTLNIIRSDPIGGLNLVVLHNNEYAILNRIACMIVKSHINADGNTATVPHDLICRQHFFDASSPDSGSFISSRYHFEFELTENSLHYIKSLIKNKPIYTSEFIFVVKNANMSINRNLYLELRRLIDTSNTARWILTMERHTFLEKSISSRALLVNCCFTLANIIKCCNLPKSLEDYYPIFIRAKGNVITFLQLTSSTMASTLLWQDVFDKFITELQNEKKQVNIIMTTREMVYKLYHIGVPFAEFCRYIIFKFGQDISDMISSIASCEHQNTKSKECLMYEKVILELYKHLKNNSDCKSKQGRQVKSSSTKQYTTDKPRRKKQIT